MILEELVKALYRAIMAGDVLEIESILSKNSDLLNTKIGGETWLHRTSTQNDIQSSNILLDYGLDVNVLNDSYEEPIISASHRGNKEILKWLISKGANVNPNQNNMGGGAIVSAVLSGDIETVEILINSGANINRVFQKNLNALKYSIIYEHSEIENLLRLNGARLPEEL